MSEEIADWIADSADYLEENGWWRNNLLGPNGRQACAMGAILFSHDLGEHDTYDPRVKAVVQAVLQQIPPDQHPYDFYDDSLTYWNDHVAANKQEVLDLFRKAEKIERAGYDPDGE